MDSYLACLRKYADFGGRSRRREYWMFTLVNTVVFLALLAISVMNGALTNRDQGESPFTAFLVGVFFLYWVALLLPNIAVTVRRLHDSGHSGWWWFIAYVPAVGWIWLLVLMILDSQPGSNEWGPNPKEVRATVPVHG